MREASLICRSLAQSSRDLLMLACNRPQ
jgi:hypothetical protein